MPGGFKRFAAIAWQRNNLTLEPTRLPEAICSLLNRRSCGVRRIAMVLSKPGCVLEDVDTSVPDITQDLCSQRNKRQLLLTITCSCIPCHKLDKERHNCDGTHTNVGPNLWSKRLIVSQMTMCDQVDVHLANGSLLYLHCNTSATQTPS